MVLLAIVICTNVVETTLHVLRDLSLALVVWINLVRGDCRDEFFGSSLEDWISFNMSMDVGIDSEFEGRVVWANACHMILLGEIRQTMMMIM